MSAQPKRYQAFLSYSHADEAAVARLHRSLEAYRLPAALVRERELAANRLRPIFRDREELSASSSLGAALEAALDDSDYLIVACSPAAARSRWMAEEIRYVQRQGRADRILCVIVAGGADEELFPEPLRHPLGPDGELDRTRRAEPLAADLRRTGDGLDSARLKLISSMLEVSYDDLARREQAARQRRLLRVAVATSIGMLAMLSLAVFAFVQRDEARVQRTVAEREAATAQQVVAFLVNTFKVADPATENPREVTAVQILERGRARLDHELTDQPVVRATLMATVGEVFRNLGLFPEADSTLQRALSIDRSDARDTADRLLALADVKLRQAEQEAALHLLEEAAPWIGQADDPALLTAEALSIRGRLALRAGRFEQARDLLEQSLGLFQARYGEIHEGTARELSRLFVAYRALGDYAAAERLIDRAVAVFLRLHGERHSATAGLIQNRAGLYLEQEKYAAALADMDRALTIMRDIQGETHPAVATAWFSRGRILMGLGRNEEAVAAFERAAEIGQAVYGRDHGFNVTVWLFEAQALARSGQLTAALALLDRATPAAAAVYPPEHPQRAFLVTQRGVVYGEAGDQENARTFCKAGLAALLADPALSPVHAEVARKDCGPWLDAG